MERMKGCVLWIRGENEGKETRKWLKMYKERTKNTEGENAKDKRKKNA